MSRQNLIRRDGADPYRPVGVLVCRDGFRYEVQGRVVVVRADVTGCIRAVERFDSPAAALAYAHRG